MHPEPSPGERGVKSDLLAGRRWGRRRSPPSLTAMRRWVVATVSVVSSMVLTSVMTGLVTLGGAVAPASAQTSFTFNGGGWGHGVGLSQYGARGRAEAGQNVGQILDAYYPGATVEGRALGAVRVKLGDAPSSELAAGAGSISGSVDGGPTVTLAGPGQRILLKMSGTTLQYQRVDNGAGPVTTLTSGGGRYTITWDAGSNLAVSATSRSYNAGQLRVIPGSGSFALVLGGLSMQQYLYGLGEMPASWSIEALKAQAIAGRSFAAYRLAHPQGADFDLYASVSDQAYVGITQTSGGSGANWIAAVDGTDGQVLTSGGQPIQAFYSSSNGGHSERSDYVFVATLPYLVATADPYDQATGNANFSWSRTYSDTELGAWLNTAGRGVGTVTGVSIGGNVGASGRVDKATVTVSGTDRTVTMTGNQFRLAVNVGAPSSRDLLSTKFALGDGPSAAAPPAPADTSAPDLKVLVGNPMRFGSSGNICAFVMSDEVAITAIHIRLGRTDLKSRVGGVGPTFPQLMCINIPPKLRPRATTKVVLTGAALDVAVNMRFVQQTVTIAR